MTDQESTWYLYGITAATFPPLPELTGVGPAGPPVVVRLLGDLQVVISASDEVGPDPVGENVLVHQRVLSAVMERGSVIPFAFGCVLPWELIAELVRTARAECHKMLKLLEGKIEVSLKLFWTQESFLADVETREIADLRTQLNRAVKSRQALLRARLGELVEQAADAKRQSYRQAIYEPLAAAAVASRLGETISPRMVLNASFLIERAQELAFDDLVNKVCGEHLKRLEGRYSGPWPPYNFVTLRMQVNGGRSRGVSDR